MLTETTLTPNSKYQLTAVHGALPMCGLTLVLTIRQTMIMVTGFLCAEITRCIYGTKSGDMMTVCRSITALSMCCKFKLPKSDDQETLNTLTTPFGELLKLTGPMFGNASNRGRLDLNALEWLDAEDYRLPEYLRTSLNMLGDTRQLVEQIMRDKNMSYNRVVFLSNNSRMSMTQLYENEKGMVHAPLMAMCNMRLFTNSTKSYAACKFSNKGSYYLVNVFSNTCIKTQLYH
ncbi:mannose receptor, C type [Sarotherodon galilaeus]